MHNIETEDYGRIGSAAAGHPDHGEQTDGCECDETDTRCPASDRAGQPAFVSDLKALVESEDSDAKQHHSLQNAQGDLHAISY
jgi:hypothetical protein